MAAAVNIEMWCLPRDQLLPEEQHYIYVLTILLKYIYIYCL